MKLFRLMVLIILTVFIHSAIASPLPIRSTIFVLQGSDNSNAPNLANFQDWMKAYKSLGMNMVTLVTFIPVDPDTGLIEPTYYHSPYNSHVITPDYMATFSDAAHAMGMQIAWKPAFVVDNNTNNNVSDWSLGTNFYPKGNSFNVKTFLSSVKSFWGKWSPVAQQHKVDMLIVGTEHGAFASSPYTQDWRDIIAVARTSFTGQLTYAENHFEPLAWAPNVQFWDALDVIGIDLYEPLGNGTANTSYTEAYKNIFENTLGMPQYPGTFSLPGILYALHKKYNKPVFLTEFGIPSIEGAMNNPADGSNPNSPVNNNEQATHFKANLDVWLNYDWFYGVNFWNQENEFSTGPSDPAFSATFQKYLANGFEFYGKPAADVIKNYFAGQATPPPIPLSERMNCVFDWVEANYAGLLSPAGTTSQTLAPYYYRRYAKTDSYLVMSSDTRHFYYLGATSSGKLLDLGAVDNWLTLAACP